MQITIVQVKVPRFQGPVGIVPSFYIWGWDCQGYWSLGLFHKSPPKFLKKVVWRDYRSGSRSRFRTWSGELNSRSFTTIRRHYRGGIVERRAETKKKREDLPCLPNRLAEPMGESFQNGKTRSTNHLLVAYLGRSGETGGHIIGHVSDHVIS